MCDINVSIYLIIINICELNARGQSTLIVEKWLKSRYTKIKRGYKKSLVCYTVQHIKL